MKTLNPLSGHDESVSYILEIANAFQKSRVLLTACELDIFTHIGDEYKSAAEIAYVASTDEKALERLLNALCSMELLNKEEDKYGNTDATKKCLVRGNPFYIGNLMHLNNLWDSWSSLTEAVQQGTSVNYQSISSRSEDRIETFIEGMHWRAAIQAPGIIEMIDLDGVGRILDLAGGSGAYAMEFARRAPEAEVFLFDLPNVIPITQKYLNADQAGHRVKTISGDYLKDAWGKGYDMVFISQVIHSNSLWDNIFLAQKIYDSLARGGRIVIQDFVLNSDRCSPPNAAMDSLNMLVNTKNGNAYTDSEIWFLLRESWFSDIEVKNTGFGTTLVFGKK